MKILGIIPARLASTRFPGKVLADIHGKPMIWWVYMAAKQAKTLDQVIVATDAMEVVQVLDLLGIPSVMTQGAHSTGTDRVAEVALTQAADIYVNIQGDEPLVRTSDIDLVVENHLRRKAQVTNAMSRIVDPSEVISETVPKVVASRENRAVFLSRAPIPHPKGLRSPVFYKQVCIYAFGRPELLWFGSSARGEIELVEDIEILRFLESQVPVNMVEVAPGGVAVDTPKDLELVRQLLVP